MTLEQNQVLPFTIDASALGGRMVRLQDTLHTILDRHAYPHAVCILLGEFMALGVSLATALKFDGVFTFEARGNGAVPLLVADITASGAVRGYAQIQGDIPNYESIQDTLVESLMGMGNMMFTVDQANTKQRYQGIVELNRPTWELCIAEYFKKSMQFQSVFRIACKKGSAGWTSGCIAIQKMPEESQKHDVELEAENWNRVVILLKSITDDELTDPSLSPEDILLRLYHEDGVRIYPPTLLHDTCRCSVQKMLNAIAQIPETERGGLLNENGVIDVHCEYCTNTQTFTPEDISLQHS